MPARLAASLILTEKNRSLTTARIFLFPCLCIEFSYNNSPQKKFKLAWSLDPTENRKEDTSYSGSRRTRKMLRVCDVEVTIREFSFFVAANLA
jgi:hypothetical protein